MIVGKSSGKHIVLEQLIRTTEIYSLFEPVVDVKEWKVIGFEVLSRFRNSGQDVSPKQVFEMAAKYDIVPQVDTMCRKKAIESIPLDDHLYFINISALQLVHEYSNEQSITLSMVFERRLDPKKLILEITDTDRVGAIDLVRNAVEKFKEKGFKFCLDNVGASGNSIVNSIELIDLMDYVKLPMEFTKSLEKNIAYLHMLSTISGICESFGVSLIYKGVETTEQLEALMETLNIRYAQGHLFSKPLTSTKLSQFYLEVEPPKREDQKKLPIGKELRSVSLKLNKTLSEFLSSLPQKDGVLVLNTERGEYLLNVEELSKKVQNLSKEILNRSMEEVLGSLNPVILPLDKFPVFSLDNEHVREEEVFSLLSRHSPFYLIRKGGRLYSIDRKDLVRLMLKRVAKESTSKSLLTGLPGRNVLEAELEKYRGQELSLIAVGMNVLKEDGRIAGELHCLMLVLKMVSNGIRHVCEMAGDCFSAHLSAYDFLMVLPGINIDRAKELGKKVLEICTYEARAICNEFDSLKFTVAVLKGGADVNNVINRVENILSLLKKMPQNTLVVEDDEFSNVIALS